MTHSFTADDDKVLRTSPVSKAVTLIGCSVAEARQRRVELGIHGFVDRAPGDHMAMVRETRTTFRPWTSTEDSIIKAEWAAPKKKMRPAARAAKKLPGRTEAAIYRRASDLGVTRKPESSRQPWTSAQIAIIRKRYPKEGAALKIEGRTQRAIKSMANKLAVRYIRQST